ncbi:cysteine desulfurase SufS [Ketogulonicigenium vulgare Y25]|nr:cysteine desulfurase SufS [Ketogulonicigenium vulgare Y25]
MFDIAKVRADFPILAREVNGKPLVYLDNGASAQKPQVVIDAITTAYSHEYGGSPPPPPPPIPMNMQMFTAACTTFLMLQLKSMRGCAGSSRAF